MNKEQIIELAKECGADIWNSPFNYIIKNGTISFEPDELFAFAHAIQDKQREAGYSEKEVQRAAACSGHTYDEWLKIKAYLPVRHNKE